MYTLNIPHSEVKPTVTRSPAIPSSMTGIITSTVSGKTTSRSSLESFAALLSGSNGK